ncbi:MAG TPA: YciI family protein [Solirubrobacteraceae bacterium]
MLLIYGPSEGLSPEEQAAESPRWYEYTMSLKNAGVHVGGEALHEVDTATTVRVRDGETQITDGPFAETKEFLGGYYIIDVPDLDTALAHAARIPNVGRGSVEVRPVVDMTQMPGYAPEAAAQA